MATNQPRLQQRRTMTHRVKDENATAKHPRHSSNPTSRFTAKDAVAGKTAVIRQALGEVTTAAINRKLDTTSSKPAGKAKEDPIAGIKRGRSDSTAIVQKRAPLGPSRSTASVPVAPVATARVPSHRPKPPAPSTRTSRSNTLETVVYNDPPPSTPGMDFEDEDTLDSEDEVDNIANEQEVEAMIGSEALDHDDLEELTPERPARQWPEFSTARAQKFHRQVQEIREHFEEEVDMFDTTMVSEYAEEIFQYMEEMEEDMMPNPDYMDGQNEITWAMRQTLVDWLLQVHMRYHMLAETLWIAINVVDRFLTKRVVSLVKLQLVGVTAMFVAAKYEEILAPSVDEFVFMTENGYTREEILKGERIMLQTLDFRISHYCSPYSWMRKISKADDYDIRTRTLSKFLTEVTLLDHRFLRVKPSLVAAIGMYCSRRMLEGDWNEAFVYYSGYTEEQLIPGFNLLITKLAEENFAKQYVCKKYANKKFLKASLYAIEWALVYLERHGSPEIICI